MSSFIGRAKHPKTGKSCVVLLIDDYFGKNKHGVRFSARCVFPMSAVEVVSGAASPHGKRGFPRKSAFRPSERRKTPDPASAVEKA